MKLGDNRKIPNLGGDIACSQSPFWMGVFSHAQIWVKSPQESLNSLIDINCFENGQK